MSSALPTPGFDPRHARRTTFVLGGLLALAAALFMVYDLQGSLSYALELRARKLAALTLVGVSLAYATVLFHTITGNRILTPSLLGFDSLYIFIQTSAAFLLGTFTVTQIDVRIRFAFELAVMLGFALLLQRWVLARYNDDLFLLVLIGIVLGTMFSGLSSLVSRMIDPNEFITLQDRMFAGFSAVDRDLLIAASVVVIAAVAISRPLIGPLDAAALGRTPAINLGVDHDRLVVRALLIAATLTSVATALVGPITFLGLIAANLAYRLTGTFRHRYTLAVSSMLGALGLVGGQFILEELLNSSTRLSIVIGFVGGVAFLGLLLKEAQVSKKGQRA